jgi:23S rRNA-/tRNA-specific pseudouridylate synthase
MKDNSPTKRHEIQQWQVPSITTTKFYTTKSSNQGNKIDTCFINQGHFPSRLSSSSRPMLAFVQNPYSYRRQQRQQQQQQNQQQERRFLSTIITKTTSPYSMSSSKHNTLGNQRNIYDKAANGHNSNHISNGSRKTIDRPSLLEPPYVVYQNNHLLVVNKPPGWHSIPNNDVGTSSNIDKSQQQQPQQPQQQQQQQQQQNDRQNMNSKCLLTYLQSQQLGGGSQKNFLTPLHRLDQPCSGLLLFGKTSKAASRIQTNWNKYVQKTYRIVVNTKNVPNIQQHSIRQTSSSSSSASSSSASWMELKGYLDKTKQNKPSSNTRSRSNSNNNNSNNKGWSVTMVPYDKIKNRPQQQQVQAGQQQKQTQQQQQQSQQQQYRLCSLKWRIVPTSTNKNEYCMLEVQTNEGARHMIRALMACYNCPIAGDVRYHSGSGGSCSSSGKNIVNVALPDMSVALHASRIELSDQIKLGEDNTSLQRTFDAKIPSTWSRYFGINPSKRPST